MNNSRGFSLVELIIVVLLLGITSAVIIPRFIGPNSFSGVAARDVLLSIIRSAQQSSLGRSSVTLEIDTVSSDWVFTANSAGTTIRTFEVLANNVKLETGSAAASADTCASGTDFNTPVDTDFELVFDSLGNLDAFTNDGTTEVVDAAFNGVRICVNDTVELSICVSPAGYAHAGNCDE